MKKTDKKLVEFGFIDKDKKKHILFRAKIKKGAKKTLKLRKYDPITRQHVSLVAL